VSIKHVGIAGAGTMGTGIAQVAALGGFEARLHDPEPEALRTGLERVRAALEKGAAKGLWSAENAAAAGERLMAAATLEDLGGCELVVEAAPERLELKRELFGRLAEICGAEVILATNTSSLPVGAIAAAVPHPDRVCGMHFFNPPALMRLVEVVAADLTAEDCVDAVARAAEAMGRTPVRCTDSPGFIVNRCNRPFTLESLRILDEGIAAHDQIDAILRDDGGYRMGPFELMDLIGVDVNLAVARSFYAQRAEPRWRPHAIQERMVAAGRLGRKSGRGFYDYPDERPPPALPPREVREAVLERIVCQLANEAAFAVGEGVAGPEEIDAAMRLGLNHPRGPFEWVHELGPSRVLATLERLRAGHDDERYEPAPVLRELAGARAGGE
jgi:3-hydroxybutyryl-CoA dehydrogenase